MPADGFADVVADNSSVSLTQRSSRGTLMDTRNPTARHLYDARLTDLQRDALDGLFEEPTCIALQEMLAYSLDVSPYAFPRVAALTRSHDERVALIVEWLDGIVLADREDARLLEMVTA